STRRPAMASARARRDVSCANEGSRMFMKKQVLGLGLVLAACVASVTPGLGQPAVTTPRQQFGFDIGDDYQLATYAQLADYWQTLDTQSDRMRLVEIGRT